MNTESWENDSVQKKLTHFLLEMFPSAVMHKEREGGVEGWG